jgi:hypothetical protein
MQNSERVRVAVRVDTHDVVQLICEHPLTDLQPKRWGTRTGVGLGDGNRERHNCDGSRARRRGQASDQASKRAPGRHRTLRSDTSLERQRNSGSFENRVTNKEHRHQPDKRPRRDTHTLTIRECPPERMSDLSRFSSVIWGNEVVGLSRAGARVHRHCQRRRRPDRTRSRRGIVGACWVASNRIDERPARSAYPLGGRNRRCGTEGDSMPDRGLSRTSAWSCRCGRGLEDPHERGRPDETGALASQDADFGEATELRVLRGTGGGCLPCPRWKGVPSQCDGRKLNIGRTHRPSACGWPFDPSRALKREVRRLRQCLYLWREMPRKRETCWASCLSTQLSTIF